MTLHARLLPIPDAETLLGAYDVRILECSGRQMGEIDTLAENFAIRVGKVHQREQTPRMEVAQPRIVIDRSMRGRASRTSATPA